MKPKPAQKKKYLLSAVLSFLTLSVLLWLVFRNHYQEILHNILAASGIGVACALLLGVVYQGLEGLICFQLVRRKHKGFSFSRAMGATWVGVFGNVVTLAVGTIPMQSAYLYRQGIALGEAAGIMSMEYVLHKTSILLYGGVMLLLGGRALFRQHPNLLPYVTFGYLVCIGIIILLILLCTWRWFYQLISRGLQRPEGRPRWADRARRLKRQAETLYLGAGDLLHTPRALWTGVGINALKLFTLYSIPYLCARSIGIEGLSLLQVQVLSALTYVISSALPNVAGMGSVEAAFLLLFSPYLSLADVSSVLILYRLATYFVPFFISALVVEIIGLRLGAAARKQPGDK